MYTCVFCVVAAMAPPEVEDPLLEPAPQRDHRFHGDETPDGGPVGHEFNNSWAKMRFVGSAVRDMSLE